MNYTERFEAAALDAAAKRLGLIDLARGHH
jgi:hypothetical protein